MIEATRSQLQLRFPKLAESWSEFRGQHRLVVAPSELMVVLRWLRDEAGFDQLIDVTATDHLEMEGAVDRFEVVYFLLSIASGDRLIIRTFLNEPALRLPSVTGLWSAANWLEREVYDMFGIVFEGHPNFKRLLLPTEFSSYPLRKDYPQQGRGERHNFPVITRAES